MNPLYPWGMFLCGGFAIGALVKWRANVRERRLRAALVSLADALEQNDPIDSQPRRIELAVKQARRVLR